MKKYPFSRRNAHDIELCKNIAYLNDDPMYYDLIELISAIQDTFDGRVSWLTGKQIGLAKKCMMIATERRAC